MYLNINSSSLLCFPSWNRSLPNGQESGQFIVVKPFPPERLGEESLVCLFPKNTCSGAVCVQLLSGEGRVQLKGTTWVFLLTEEALKWVKEMKESYNFTWNKLLLCSQGLDGVVPKTWRYSAKRLENNVSERVGSKICPGLGLMTSRFIISSLISMHHFIFIFLSKVDYGQRKYFRIRCLLGQADA